MTRRVLQRCHKENRRELQGVFGGRKIRLPALQGEELQPADNKHLLLSELRRKANLNTMARHGTITEWNNMIHMPTTATTGTSMQMKVPPEQHMDEVYTEKIGSILKQ